MSTAQAQTLYTVGMLGFLVFCGIGGIGVLVVINWIILPINRLSKSVKNIERMLVEMRPPPVPYKS
jgi:hypothetical protein